MRVRFVRRHEWTQRLRCGDRDDGEQRCGFGESYSTTGIGVEDLVFATTGSTIGVLGSSYSTTGGIGVIGQALCLNGPNFGVYGANSSVADGCPVYYSNSLTGSGTKSCVVKTSKRPTLPYCQESLKNWSEDFGEGQLVNGRCHIELEPVFLETVTIDVANPMKVFVQLQDDWEETFVKPGRTAFDGIELPGGAAVMPSSFVVFWPSAKASSRSDWTYARRRGPIPTSIRNCARRRTGSEKST